MPIFGPKTALGGNAGSAVVKQEREASLIGRRMTKSQKMLLNAEVDAVYLYNISPIFKWTKDYPGLGTLFLGPRDKSLNINDPELAQKLKPYTISKRTTRPVDKGNNIRDLFIEEPIEIGEDAIGIGNETRFMNPENSWARYGCFLTVGESLAEIDPKAAQSIIDEAETKHINKLMELVAQADILYKQFPSLVCEVHRQGAIYLGVEEDHEWVARRGRNKSIEPECIFCGFNNKAGVPKCRNCSEIIDQEAYDALKAKIKGKKGNGSESK